MSRQPPSSERQKPATYPLRTIAARKVQDKEHRREQARWNGNGQGATNDSAEYKAAVTIIDGFPVEYSCMDDPREYDIEQIDVKELVITFDYEMLTEGGFNPEDSVRPIEWSLLWNTANRLGLHNCNHRKQKPLSLRRLSENAESYILGLSSLDFDRMDDEIETCTALGGSSSVSTICTPMKGNMTAFFMGDKDIVTTYLESIIEEELNSERVRIEAVKECRYIGKRSVSLDPNGNRVEKLDTKNNTTNLALVTVFSVMIAGIFMLSFALLMTRRRRIREEMMLDDDAPLQQETIPAVIFEKENLDQPSPNVEHSSSGDTEESVPDRVESEESDRGLQTISVVTIITGQCPDVGGDLESQPMEGNDGVDTPDAEAEGTGNLDTTPHVPPVCVVPVDELPPKEPTKSKTLQTRRKRKKKKKKPVLKRISSKQSINEMETINETDEVAGEWEEGSEFDGSECSEYTTDDDDDLVVAVNASGSNEDSDSPRISPGNLVPPSPIREEPKIRPLPPPWI